MLRPPSGTPWPTMCLAVAMTRPPAIVGRLDAAHVGAPMRRRQVRVLAVGLLEPTPARVARDVEDRREGLAARPSPRRSRPMSARHRLDELGVPGGGLADRLREAGRVAAITPCRLSSCTMAGMPSRVSSTRKRWIAFAEVGDLPAAAGWWRPPPASPGRCRAPAARRARSQVEAVAVEDLERPQRAQLGQLLVQRHARQQVARPLPRWTARGRGRAASGRHGRGRCRRRPCMGSLLGLRHPLTAPDVSPPMSCRSANT